MAEIVQQPIRYFYFMVFEANTHSKKKDTTWKAMKSWVRKCFIFLCTINFEVTWPFWKMWGVIFSSHQPNLPWWLWFEGGLFFSLQSPILVILDDYFDNIELPSLLEMPSKIRRGKMKVWTYSVRMLRIITGVAGVEWTLYTLWTRSLFLRFGACFMEL